MIRQVQPDLGNFVRAVGSYERIWSRYHFSLAVDTTGRSCCLLPASRQPGFAAIDALNACGGQSRHGIFGVTDANCKSVYGWPRSQQAAVAEDGRRWPPTQLMKLVRFGEENLQVGWL
jgi:hypothetical protein